MNNYNTLNIKDKTPLIIVSGAGFADALSVASISQIKNYPMILTSKDKLSKEAEEYIKRINPSKVYIIGGEGVVSENVKEKISVLTALDKNNITRISGKDRYKTNINVLKYFDIKGDTVALASGVNFPDSLVGSIYAAHSNAPILLINNNMNLSEQIQYINSKSYKKCIIFGGRAVVDENLF